MPENWIVEHIPFNIMKHLTNCIYYCCTDTLSAVLTETGEDIRMPVRSLVGVKSGIIIYDSDTHAWFCNSIVFV